MNTHYTALLILTSFFISCKDEPKSGEIGLERITAPAETVTVQQADAASGPHGELIYSRGTLLASVGVALEPLVATPGFSDFRSDSELPKGLFLDSRSGTISGTPLEAAETKVFRISAHRIGQSSIIELPVTVYGVPATPQAPIPSESFTSKTELSFQWTAASTSSLEARVIQYQVQLVKELGRTGEFQIIDTQKTNGNSWSFAVMEEGTYAAKISSTDAMGRSSGFSELSSRVIVDRTPPTSASITKAFVMLSPGTLAAYVEWSPAQDGIGSLPADLIYSVCYEGPSSAFVVPNTCEPMLASLPNVKGATNLTLPPVQRTSDRSEISFRVITEDQVGNKVLSEPYTVPFLYIPPSGPGNDN